MPWKSRNPSPDWLKPYCKQLLSNLADQGCTSATLRTHERVAAAFCQEVRHCGLRKDELVRETLAKVHTATLNTFCPNKFLYKRFCFDRLSPCWSMRSPAFAWCVDSMTTTCTAQLRMCCRRSPSPCHPRCRRRWHNPVFGSVTVTRGGQTGSIFVR